MAEQSKSQ